MSALQPNSFLTHFSLKPCTKVTAASLQPVLMFALYPIVAVCVLSSVFHSSGCSPPVLPL